MERSSDRKVTPLARWAPGAKRWEPIIKSTIGTLAGVTCPGKTEWCMNEKSNRCYAWRTEQYYSNARKLVERNTIALEAATTVAKKIVLYEKAVTDFKIDFERAQKRVSWPIEKVFRFFWDGDVRTKEDARAIRAVCNKHPDVNFWQYTRSFDFAPLLLGPENLVVYLSVDRYNIEQARSLMESTNPREAGSSGSSFRYAFCGDNWEETEELAYSLTGRNAPRCPELTGRYELVVDKGDGYGVGACVECGLCIRGVNNVRFSAH